MFPCSSSTDFEVHRNWLSIVSKVPVSRWYTEATSEWTIDYPPLFCWFEYILSLLAKVVLGINHDIFKLSSKPVFSTEILYFQRFTVILSDIVYFYGAFKWLKIITGRNRGSLLPQEAQDSYNWVSPTMVTTILMLLNPGLLLVDHIHFQYNGFLTGILLISLAEMHQDNFVSSSIWFCILLNLKHLYIYLAPAYFVYILRKFCLDRHFNFKKANFLKVSVAVILIFLLSFGPFIMTGQMGNVMKRLFPFKRGLTHAYWAPNAWALYNFLDRLLSTIFRIRKSSSSSSGLVQDVSNDVLPDMPASITFAIVATSMTPALIYLWKKCHFSLSGGDQRIFIRTVIICAFSSFIFGFHIHEKHLLLVMIPLTPLVLLDFDSSPGIPFSIDTLKVFLILMVTGTYSFFPLLFQEAETPTKILILALYAIYAFQSLNISFIEADTIDANNGILEKIPKLPFLNLCESIYIYGFILLQFYVSVGHQLLFTRLPFLPLMLTSVYCSLGVGYTYWQFYASTLEYI